MEKGDILAFSNTCSKLKSGTNIISGMAHMAVIHVFTINSKTIWSPN